MEDGAPKELFGGKPHRFQSGPNWKGNRHGRPPKKVEPPPPPPPPTVQELARGHGPEMIEALAKIAKDTGMAGSTRVAAANALLDRGFGKPKPEVEAQTSAFDRLTEDELMRFLLAKVLAGRTVGELIEHAPSDEDGGEEE